MLRCSWIAPLVLAACGGGGGGSGSTPPVAPGAVLAASDAVVPPAADAADVIVSLRTSTEPPPALLEAHVELPPQLRIAGQGGLTALSPAPVDGDFHGDRFVVVCGDSSSPSANPLPAADLFRLRLQPTQPRQPGTYTVTLRDLRAASSEGAQVPLEIATIPVVVRIE